jgi:electron transfer flavoprotein beta subunit
MRILVSFKVTPDYEALRPADWAPPGESAAAGGGATGGGAGDGAAGRVPGAPETRFVRRVLNTFDESALELALRLRDELGALGERAALEAVTVGGRETDGQLKTLLALGYERATRIDPAAGLDFAPDVVADLIAAHAGLARCDLLLLGSRSGPGDGGTVPFAVAEQLGRPCLAQVTAIETLPESRLRVTCVADDGLLRVTLRPPCVLAVGNAVVSRLRVPTLTDRLARRGAAIDVVGPAELGVGAALEARRWTPVRFTMIDRRRAGVVVDGEDAREKARALLETHLLHRLGDR